MTGLAVCIIVTAAVVLLWLLCEDSLRSLERARAVAEDITETRRRTQLRALARELVDLDATVLVTPRDVEIPLDLLRGDLGLEEALETLDSIAALS